LGSGLGVEVSGFRFLVYLGRESGPGVRVSSLVFRVLMGVYGFGFRVSGIPWKGSFVYRVSVFGVLVATGFQVSSFGFRVSG